MFCWSQIVGTRFISNYFSIEIKNSTRQKRFWMFWNRFFFKCCWQLIAITFQITFDNLHMNIDKTLQWYDRKIQCSKWYTVKNAIVLKFHRICDNTLIKMGVNCFLKLHCIQRNSSINVIKSTLSIFCLRNFQNEVSIKFEIFISVK